MSSLLEDFVIDRQHGAAGIAEDVLDAIVLQACRTISAPVIRMSLMIRFPSLRIVARITKFSGIKKGPRRSLVQRMGGYRRTVTPSCPCAFHYKNVCEFDHGRCLNRICEPRQPKRVTRMQATLSEQDELISHTNCTNLLAFIQK